MSYRINNVKTARESAVGCVRKSPNAARMRVATTCALLFGRSTTLGHFGPSLAPLESSRPHLRQRRSSSPPTTIEPVSVEITFAGPHPFRVSSRRRPRQRARGASPAGALRDTSREGRGGYAALHFPSRFRFRRRKGCSASRGTRRLLSRSPGLASAAMSFDRAARPGDARRGGRAARR